MTYLRVVIYVLPFHMQLTSIFAPKTQLFIVMLVVLPINFKGLAHKQSQTLDVSQHKGLVHIATVEQWNPFAEKVIKRVLTRWQVLGGMGADDLYVLPNEVGKVRLLLMKDCKKHRYWMELNVSKNHWKAFFKLNPVAERKWERRLDRHK